MLWFFVIGIALIILGAAFTDPKDNPITMRRINSIKIDNYLKKLDGIQLDKKYISQDKLTGVGLDYEGNKLVIFKPNENEELTHVTYNFNDIIESEIVEDGVSLMKTSRANQFAGLAIGTALAGGVGAIVGGLSTKKVSSDEVSSVDLKLIVNDIDSPVHVINYLTPIASKTKSKNSPEYKESLESIRDWHGTMRVIIERLNN